MTDPGSTPDLPDAAAILDFIRDSDSPVGRREIARAFGVKAAARRALADTLDALEADGRIERGRNRRYSVAERVPSVAVIEVTALDADGEPVVALAERRLSGLATHVRLVAERGQRNAPGVGDRMLARLTALGDGRFEARVMRRLENRPSSFVGTYFRARDGGRVEPAARRARAAFIVPPNQTGGAEDGELVVCETLRERVRGIAAARVTERIGRLDEPGAASLLAIAENDIPTEFSEAAQAQADTAGPAPLDARLDLRDLPLVTIDDAEARDFDDAVWAAPDETRGNPGGWQLRVAIADVGWYVRPGDALDAAAYERGNSVYFPDRVVPMLPEALSNGWCSLKPGEDRPCVTVWMRISPDGEKLEHRFDRAMMRSAARLTYDAVQAMRAPGASRDDLPAPLIEALYGAFAALSGARERRGAIDLDLPERHVLLDAAGAVTGIARRVRLDSHRLIEEFMILANVCAAETLERHDQPCMYRVHDDPAPDRVFALRQYLGALGMSLAGGQAVRPRHFAQLIRRIAGRPDAAGIQESILRCQAQAVYSPENLGHFGLALRRYAHFTSPIRRYSDLLVHRALIRGLGLGDDGLADAEAARFAAIGTHISMTERRAVAAERGAFDRLSAQYLADRVGATFAARITGVERFGVFVELEETGASGLLPRSLLGDGAQRFDERRRSLTTEGAGTLRLGDRLEVTLIEANPAAGSLVFRPAGRKQPAGRTARKGGGAARKSARRSPRRRR